MAINKVIDPIPEAPQRSDPQNFDERADAFLKRIETLDDDLNEWANQCNQTQAEINQARDDAQSARDTAYQHKENAYKWANENEDTQVDDGEHTGYSSYHWAKKSEKLRDQAYKWANEDVDTQVDDGVHQGYSAYHWMKKTEILKNETLQAITSGSNYKGDWDSSQTYSVGDTVKYQDMLWISLVDNNQGVEPGADESKWLSISRVPEFADSWVGGNLVTQPEPYMIPVLNEEGFIDVFISDKWFPDKFQSEFKRISSFTMSANTVYQAQHNCILYAVVGSSDITFYLDANNPPNESITLKANNTCSLVIPKGFYLKSSTDLSVKILSKEGSNVLV